jgi:GGDEF domain-containing protein
LPLVTLKKYLFDGEVDVRPVLSTLFKGVASSAVRADKADHDGLTAELQQIQARIEGECTGPQLSTAAGEVIHALEAYNQRATRFITQQGCELQKMIAMLAESVIAISGSSERSSQALGELRLNLEHAGGLEDLQNVKARLRVCLEQVCAESARRRAEDEQAILDLQNHIRQAERHLTPERAVDDITGLGGRMAAEAAMREAAAAPGRKYVAVLVLDRLQSIHARFGTKVGDRVLAELARHVESQLPAGDTMFRLSGPTLLILMSRTCTIDRMRIDLKPLLNRPLEKEFDVGGRSVLIPVSPAWTVVGLVPPVTTILKHIDAFVATQIPKDYV